MLMEEKIRGGSERGKEMTGAWERGRKGKNMGGIKYIYVYQKRVGREGGTKGTGVKKGTRGT